MVLLNKGSVQKAFNEYFCHCHLLQQQPNVVCDVLLKILQNVRAISVSLDMESGEEEEEMKRHTDSTSPVNMLVAVNNWNILSTLTSNTILLSIALNFGEF